jgi:hypothetical protein
MPYKPKYCSQCAEKIERIDWQPWHSRRFCELCATDLGINERVSLFLPYVFIVILLAVLANFWRTPEKNLNVAPNQFISKTQNNAANETNRANQTTQASSNSSVQSLSASNFSAKQPKTVTATTQNPQTNSIENPAQEAVYFCGAPTKKGTPCSRRVKGGGRCWQHIGQKAMLPQEKLLVSNN